MAVIYHCFIGIHVFFILLAQRTVVLLNEHLKFTHVLQCVDICTIWYFAVYLFKSI